VVYSASAGKKSRVGTVIPRQVVVEIDAQAQWIQIEYHDKNAGATLSGWVLKKYFERLSERTGEAVPAESQGVAYTKKAAR
jgi:hypothetical protein